MTATATEQTAADALATCLGFFASVIKSGEPWTETCEREYRAALARYDAEKNGGGWRTMESAPKDGPILVWDEAGDAQRVATWCVSIEDGDGAWVYARQLSVHAEDGVARAFIVRNPKLWQPLPTPPSASQDGER